MPAPICNYLMKHVFGKWSTWFWFVQSPHFSAQCASIWHMSICGTQTSWPQDIYHSGENYTCSTISESDTTYRSMILRAFNKQNLKYSRINKQQLHNTTITMIKLRSDLQSRTASDTSSLRGSYGVSFVSNTKKNARDISRALEMDPDTHMTTLVELLLYHAIHIVIPFHV